MTDLDPGVLLSAYSCGPKCRPRCRPGSRWRPTGRWCGYAASGGAAGDEVVAAGFVAVTTTTPYVFDPVP